METAPQETSTSPDLVVGVGASAGGLEAFKALLRGLTVRTGVAWVLVQHLDPDHDSMLVELLDHVTALAVVEASDGAHIEPDTIYVIRPGTSLAVDGARLVETPPRAERGRRLPIDDLFRSMADTLGPRAVGIVLSGAGRDGSIGLRHIRAREGLTLAQTPSTASQPDMPQSAIDTGAVDVVTPIARMPEIVRRYAEMIADKSQDDTVAASEDDDTDDPTGADWLPSLSALLETRAEFDIRHYKAATIVRRVRRRMRLCGFESATAYIDELRADDEERRQLVADLLIGVTSFFRDPEAFDALQSRVVDSIIEQLEPRAPVRLWVAGCSTGEEAYSLAMVFIERLEQLEHPHALQIFATDIDADALTVARAGFYPSPAVEGVSQARLDRFFTPVGEHGFQVVPRLRDAISFAVHDLCNDPPFSRMQLVSCRNVLIYLRPAAQEHVLRVLNFALDRDGFLLLGSSETLGAMQRFFTPVSKKWRIYKKIGSAGLASRSNTDRRWAAPDRPSPSRSSAAARRDDRAGLTEPALRALVATRVPPSVVVTGDGAVVYLHGELRPYLRFPEGEPRHDIGSMLRAEMATRVRGALFKCRRDDVTVESICTTADDAQRVRVTASPATGLGPGAVVLSFEPLASDDADIGGADEHTTASGADAALIEQLERELLATRDDLRSTVEELETSNEELRASNEESMSMNEELQSSNEELEATSEELRSLNEELTSVNAKLVEKIGLLEQAHDDIRNFFTSARLPILFLDEELRIKRLTPAAIELLRITREDLGRYAPDIARELLQNGLVDDARRVLEQLAPVSRELRTRDGCWVTRRILPYRTQSRRVDGVVVSLVDVTAIKSATERLAVRERQQSVIARLGLLALEERDIDVFFHCVVREVQQTLGTDLCKLLELQPSGDSLVLRAGVGWSEGLVGRATVSAGLESQAGYTLSTSRPVIVEDLATERRFTGPPLLSEHGVVSGISCTIRGSDGAYGVIGAHTRQPRHFTTEDTGFLEAVAAIASAAIARHQAQIRLALENRVSNALAAASTLREAALGVFDVFSSVLEVCVGELWLPVDSSPDAPLGCTLLWTAETLDHAAVAEQFSSDTFAPGEGIIGRVWSRGLAEWLTPFRISADFVRRERAARLGLHSGFAWPVDTGERTLGVMTVFATSPMPAHEGMLRAVEGIGRTVGQVARRLEAEAATREREDAFREVFDNAGVSLWVEDFSRVGAHFDALREAGVTDLVAWLDEHPEFIDEAVGMVDVVEVNDETLKLFGGHRPDVTIESLRDVFLDDTREAFRLELEALAAGRSRLAGETTLRRLDGRQLDVTFAVRFPPEVRDLRHVIVSMMDVSELRETQRQLEESRRWFNHLTETTPDAVSVIAAHDGRVLYHNQGASQLLGFTVGDAGRFDLRRSHIHDDDLDGTENFFEELAERLTADSDACEHTYRIRNAAGRSRWIHARCVPFGDQGSGTLDQILLVARDVTELKRAELDLLAASRQKDEFLAMLGHELRNPLAAIRSASELLRLMHTDDTRLQRTRSILERQTAHMSKLLDGLLDVSRIVRGKIQLDVAPTDLVEIVNHVVGDKLTRVERRPVELVVDAPKGPLLVDGDRVRLTQIVDNLLTNALKFTRSGRIDVVVERDPECVRLEVRDTGVGIAPELLPHIFESFQQAGQSLDRAHGGLGLGLALVRSLVELHGGSVEAFSDGVGTGSRFVVRLPTSRSTLAPDAVRSVSHCARDVLVVEDNHDAANLLKEILEASGHRVAVAYDGHEALARVEDHVPEVVICDLGLPGGMSGFEVAAAIRQMPDASDVALIALSGYGRAEDKRKAVEAGFNAHLTKPVDLAVIEDTIASISPSSRSRG